MTPGWIRLATRVARRSAYSNVLLVWNSNQDSWLETLSISWQTLSSAEGGTCSSTSAQKTKSNEPSVNCIAAAFPLTHRIFGWGMFGSVRSSAVTPSKRSAIKSEKWPSRAPMSNALRPLAGMKRRRSVVLCCSEVEARYLVKSIRGPNVSRRITIMYAGQPCIFTVEP